MKIAISITAENDTAVESEDIQWNITFSGKNLAKWSGNATVKIYQDGEFVADDALSVTIPSGSTSVTTSEQIGAGTAGEYWIVVETTPAIDGVISREVSPIINVSEASA